eukprot:g2398.t1
MSATENETARSAGYSQSECTDAQTDQETFDLGLNEFHLEAADNDCYAVTDGSGVRLSLLVAPRVNIIGAQVTSVDGGWGPLSLRKVQQAGLGVSKTSFLILHHPFLFFQFVR